MIVKNKELILNILGSLIMLLAIFSVFDKLFILKDIRMLVWYCNIAFFLIGGSILLRNSVILASTVNILLIPLFLWIIDYIIFIPTGISYFGIVGYIVSLDSLWRKIYTLHHVFNATIPLFALYLIKIKKNELVNALKLSFVQIIAIFGLTRLLVPSPGLNLNWVYPGTGVPLSFSPAVYPFVWFGALGAFILTSYSIISKPGYFTTK